MVIEHRIEYFCRTIPPEPSQQMTWWPISPLSVTFSSSDLPISRSKAFNFFWSQLHVFGVSTQPCATSSCCESTNSNPNWTKFKSFNLWIENAGYIGQAFYICPSFFLSIQVSIPHAVQWFNFFWLESVCLNFFAPPIAFQFHISITQYHYVGQMFLSDAKNSQHVSYFERFWHVWCDWLWQTYCR